MRSELVVTGLYGADSGVGWTRSSMAVALDALSVSALALKRALAGCISSLL